MTNYLIALITSFMSIPDLVNLIITKLTTILLPQNLYIKYLAGRDLIEEREIKALEKIVEYVNSTDHFAEVFYADPAADRYDFMIRQLVDGLKVINRDETKLIEIIF